MTTGQVILPEGDGLRHGDLELDDAWDAPHVEYVPKASPDEPWDPPASEDAVRRRPAQLISDGVLAMLGLHRLRAVQEARALRRPTRW